MKRLFFSFLILTPVLLLTFSTRVTAQTAATPTIFCLGNTSCAGDVSPTATVAPTGTEVSPTTDVTLAPTSDVTTEPQETIAPTDVASITPTTTETITPCPTESTESTVSVQHRHHHHGGWIRKGMRGFLQMLIDLINKLLERLGGGDITLPPPSNPCGAETPTPTVTETPTPSPTESGTFTPSVTVAPSVTPSIAQTTPGAAVSGLLIGMGDSYTSAFGAPPYSSPEEPCYHSTSTSYVQVAAKALGGGVTSKNIACSGADTEDVGITYGGEAAQVGRLVGAKWVAITIGGNDFDSLGSVTNGATGPQNLINNVSKIQSNVEGVITKVKANVPGVKVFIFGYPSILPTDQSKLSASTCFGDQASSVNFALATQMYTKMNASIKAAATATGAIYIDAPTAFVGHDMCADANWIGRLTDDDNEHPNVAGHAEMGKLLQQAIQANP
jgi:lysophospholipase L1-like esterase